MIGLKSIIHQGWHAKRYSNARIEDCPYPTQSSSAKDWRSGWDKAYKNEPWEQPRRKVRVEE